VDRLFDGEDFRLDGVERALNGVLPYATSCDVVLRTPDMTRRDNLALCVPSGGS
jgi:hypothetical protein